MVDGKVCFVVYPIDVAVGQLQRTKVARFIATSAKDNLPVQPRIAALQS